jgi:hypothetical protein
MDSDLLARIGDAHRIRLEWFEQHRGEVTGFPGPLADDLLLSGKAKGIYKPKDLEPYSKGL